MRERMSLSSLLLTLLAAGMALSSSSSCSAPRSAGDDSRPTVELSSLDQNKPGPQEPIHRLGRRVAGFAWRTPAEIAQWDPGSEEWYQPLLNRLKELTPLSPGMIVVDLGAGAGTLSFMLAREVEGPPANPNRGPRPAPTTGKVFAVEIQPALVGYIAGRCSERRVKNVEPVLSTDTTIGLPQRPAGKMEGWPGEVDLVVLREVYHELSDPAAILADIRLCLRPPDDRSRGGLVAVVENAKGEGASLEEHPHSITLSQLVLEWAAAGFDVVATDDSIEGQLIVIFTPAASVPR